MSIKWLKEHICEELVGAETYAKMAIKAKEEGRMEHYSILGTMAEQEYAHAELLLDICKDKEAKKEMDVHQEVWDYMKECISDQMIKAKALMTMLK